MLRQPAQRVTAADVSDVSAIFQDLTEPTLAVIERVGRQLSPSFPARVLRHRMHRPCDAAATLAGDPG